jgi:hypothetical protein
MDDEHRTDQPVNESWTPPEERNEETVGGDAEPVGPDNIREGTVRGTIHGGPTASEGQGQGG